MLTKYKTREYKGSATGTIMSLQLQAYIFELNNKEKLAEQVDKKTP